MTSGGTRPLLFVGLVGYLAVTHADVDDPATERSGKVQVPDGTLVP